MYQFKSHLRVTAKLTLKLIKLLSEDKRCRMNGPDKVKISVSLSDILERVKFIKDFLSKIFLT